MSVWLYWRLFWENVNYDYLTVLTNESDNTKRIKEEKKIEKNTKILEKYIREPVIYVLAEFVR